MENCNYAVSRLPDIEIYAGDTSSWTVNLFHEDKSPYVYEELFGAACVFTVKQFGVLNTDVSSAIITKRIPFMSDDPEESVSLKIKFDVVDTLALRGKYIYQIEIITGQSNMVYQGYLRILQNLSR